MKWLLAFLPVVAYADTGLSYLAMCHPKWPCKDSLEALPRPLVTGWLEDTFGTNCNCVKAFLKLPGPKTIRVHLLNGPCLRNQRCGPYEAFAGLSVAKADRLVLRRDGRLLGRVKRASERVAKRIESAKDLTCYVSPCLECDLSAKARAILAETASKYLPQCKLVDNPVRGRCLPGFICEKHGPDPKLKAPCIADLDGIAAEDTDVEKYLERTKSCELQYLWTYAYNCIASPKFVDPRKRTCKVAEEYFR